MMNDECGTVYALRREGCLCTFAVFCVLLLPGCGTGLEDTLGGLGLLPDVSSLSLDVREACADVKTEQEMLTSVVAARIDQANGYTKDEQLLNVTTNCALEAVFSGVSAEDCIACKRAILDQVYGE